MTGGNRPFWSVRSVDDRVSTLNKQKSVSQMTPSFIGITHAAVKRLAVLFRNISLKNIVIISLICDLSDISLKIKTRMAVIRRCTCVVYCSF